jgi:hypothetical protein
MEELRAFAIVAVLSVSALASLIKLGRGTVAAVSLGQIETDQLRAIKLVFFPSKDAGEPTGDPRKNLHGAG